jgi:hypothetical protein
MRQMLPTADDSKVNSCAVATGAAYSGARRRSAIDNIRHEVRIFEPVLES